MKAMVSLTMNHKGENDIKTSKPRSRRLSRREMLKWTGVVAAGSLLAAYAPGKNSGQASPARLPLGQGLQGTVIITTKGGVKIHSYVSPENSLLVTSHIIESANSLVIVDALFLVPYAKEWRAYADGLNKPVDRIIISHAHPDHYWGLAAAFEDVPGYALPGVQQAIETTGPGTLAGLKPDLGDLAPDKIVVPTQALDLSPVTIDGVRYEFERYLAGEAPEQVLIKLPEAGILISQDLSYNQVHLFTANNTLENWQTLLTESLQPLAGYDVVLPGHGEPTDATVFAANLAYLQDARHILDHEPIGGVYRTQLLEKYPAYRGTGLLDLSVSFLFPNSSQMFLPLISKS